MIQSQEFTMAGLESYSDDDVRAWMNDSSAGADAASAFPFQALQDCELADVTGNIVLFKNLYMNSENKKTMLMFGRNLL